MKVWTDVEHATAAFRECPKPCIGGQMFWQWAEPQWRRELGLVGICTHCGAQIFTGDVLSGTVIPQPVLGSPQRRGGPRVYGDGGGRKAGGWKRNSVLFPPRAA